MPERIAAHFFEELEATEVAEAIREDISAARRVGLRGIPYLMVDGRHVPRRKLGAEPVLELILDQALETVGERREVRDTY